MAIQYIDQCCDIYNTVAPTYNIVAATNDKLQFTIDGGAAQNITLTPGAARTVAQIVTDINATLTSAIAYAITTGPQTNRFRIRTTSNLGATSTILVGAPANNANATLGLTAAAFTGYGRGHTAWAQVLGTKQELINKIETELLAVGWTTISGSGTTNLLVQSALTPPSQNLQYRIRVKDNAGVCVQLSIENLTGTLASANSTTGGCSLLPAVAKNWLFTVNKYQICIRSAGNAIARSFVFAGCPALPTFLEGILTEAAFIGCDSGTGTDGDVNVRASFKIGTSNCMQQSQASNSAQITNGVLAQVNNSSVTLAQGHILTPCTFNPNAITAGIAGWKWHDNSIAILDAIIGWYSAASGGIFWRGYLWDALTFGDPGSIPVDSLTTIDSHNWISITDNIGRSANTGPVGGLFLCKP